MDALAILVAGEPVPKARPRAAVVHGHARIYTPATSRAYEIRVRSAALRVMEGGPLAGPLAVRLEFVLPVPESWSKRKRAAAFSGQLYPAIKPDIDNYAKAVLDGLNGVAFGDDAQITDLIITKRYGAEPCAIARIREIVAPLLALAEARAA